MAARTKRRRRKQAKQCKQLQQKPYNHHSLGDNQVNHNFSELFSLVSELAEN